MSIVRPSPEFRTPVIELKAPKNKEIRATIKRSVFFLLRKHANLRQYRAHTRARARSLARSLTCTADAWHERRLAAQPHKEQPNKRISKQKHWRFSVCVRAPFACVRRCHMLVLCAFCCRVTAFCGCFRSIACVARFLLRTRARRALPPHKTREIARIALYRKLPARLG